MRIISAALCAIFLLLPVFSFSQETLRDSAMVRIVTTDGNQIKGRVLSQDASTVVLKTENLGEVSVTKQTIKRIEVLNDPTISKKDRRYWPDDRRAMQYFFGQNGYGLRKGEGYYQNILIAINQVNFGLTDHFSFGVGVVPGIVAPIWITPKVSIPLKKDRVNLAIGASVGTIIGGAFFEWDRPVIFGKAYTKITLGPRHQNISIGAGAFFAPETVLPMLTLDGAIRVGKRVALISENYIVSSEASSAFIPSAGVRLIWPKIQLDAALFTPVGAELDEVWITGFIVGVGVPFGGKRD